MAEGHSRIWIWLLVGGGVFALFVVAVFTLVFLSFGGRNEESFSGFGSRIAVVELDGVIFSPKQIVPQLKKFADDNSVKAIIIHVNSPGGGVAASEEIYREVKPAEREYMQGLVDNMHTQFIQAVADGRHTKEEDIRAIANGKVWTGEQAFSLKLVDQIADFEGAVKDTARAVNISGEPTLVYPPKQRRSGLDLLFGDVSDYLPTREKLLEQQVGFYYLWK